MCAFHSKQLCLPERRPRRDAHRALCSAEGGVLNARQGGWLPQTSSCQHESVFERCYSFRYQQEVREDTLCCTSHLVVQASFFSCCFFCFFSLSLWENYFNFFTGCFSGATTLHIFSATVEKIQTVGCKYQTYYYPLKKDCICSELVKVSSLQIWFCSRQTLFFFNSARWLKGCSFGAR